MFLEVVKYPDKIQQHEILWFVHSFLQQPEVAECRDIILVENRELFFRELKTSPVSQICTLVNTLWPLYIISNFSLNTKMQGVEEISSSRDLYIILQIHYILQLEV